MTTRVDASHPGITTCAGLPVVDEAYAAALVVRLRRGDRDAWGQLYRCYQPRVRAYLSPRMSGLPCEDLEDLVQDTFLRAVLTAEDFAPEATPAGAWLCGCAALALSDFFRKQRFGHRAAVRIAVDAIRRGSVESDEARESRPVSPRVVTALAQLTPGQRRAMQLRYLDGLSSAAAAAVVGSRPATIVSHCLVARKRMRIELADLAPRHSSWLATVSKKTAMRAAFAVVGPDARAALVWLREQGIEVTISYVYQQARAVRAAQRAADTHQTHEHDDVLDVELAVA
jgi:RNA polymerase sigma-70 factor (ECF subfamily)